jgi:hypothetical protein
MQTQKTYKRMTAKQIVKRKIGETNGEDNISKGKNNEDIIWNYRTNTNEDGTIDNINFWCCDKENAEYISIEDFKFGIVAILDI